jgi:thioredoxin-related protein
VSVTTTRRTLPPGSIPTNKPGSAVVQPHGGPFLKIRLIAAATLALALAPSLVAGTWLKSVAAAQKVAKEKNQLILVDMFAEWCGWCHRFEREVFPSLVFQQATADIVLLRLDTEDGGEGTKMARQYGVTSLPTFLLLTPDLTTAGVIKGYAPPNEFVQRLNQTREKHVAFEKRLANEPKLAKDYFQRLEIAKEFVNRSAFAQSEPRLRKLIAEKGVPAAVRDEAYYQLAVGYVLQSKADEAIKTVNKLTSMSKLGDSVERSRLLLGQVYLQQGNLEAARNEFRTFLTTYPNSPLTANVKKVLPEIERRLAFK